MPTVFREVQILVMLLIFSFFCLSAHAKRVKSS